jgi:hypothetical protein
MQYHQAESRTLDVVTRITTFDKIDAGNEQKWPVNIQSGGSSLGAFLSRSSGLFSNLGLRSNRVQLTPGNDGVTSTDDDESKSEAEVDPKRYRIPVFAIGVLLFSADNFLGYYCAERFENGSLKRRGWNENSLWCPSAVCIFAGLSLMCLIVPFVL